MTLNHLCQKGGQSVLYTQSKAESVVLWAVLVTLSTAIGCAGPNAAFRSDATRDFPPLVDPDAPALTHPAHADGAIAGSSDDMPVVENAASTPPAFEPSDRVRVPVNAEGADFAYRLGVSDEVSIVVLGQPSYTRPAKVLPDGSISSTGTGTVYVLGMTVAEAAREIEDRLRSTLRFPKVDLVVTQYGDHVIYVMGEVEIPADHAYRKGMSALQGVAAAGGFKDSAKRTNVCIFRRTGPDVAEFIQLDLKDALGGKSFEDDLILRPYDIIYVPKSVIGNVNTFVDQYFRQNLAALNFYLTGWDSYSVTKDRVTIQRTN